MNKVVRTSREVRFTETIAWKGYTWNVHGGDRPLVIDLKEKSFEEVGGVDNDENQHSGQVDRQDSIQDPSF